MSRGSVEESSGSDFRAAVLALGAGVSIAAVFATVGVVIGRPLVATIAAPVAGTGAALVMWDAAATTTGREYTPFVHPVTVGIALDATGFGMLMCAVAFELTTTVGVGGGFGLVVYLWQCYLQVNDG